MTKMLQGFAHDTALLVTAKTRIILNIFPFPTKRKKVTLDCDALSKIDQITDLTYVTFSQIMLSYLN